MSSLKIQTVFTNAIIIIIIIFIIIIIIIRLFDSLQLSGVLLGNVYCVSATPRSLETPHFTQQVNSSKDDDDDDDYYYY